MKYSFLVFFIFTISFNSFNQTNDSQIFSEGLMFVKDNSPLNISNLNIDVKALKNIAITTFDITFKNPNNRILEGELNFPLGEGQTISHFAMDINGKLREAVPVEKEKGQKVFEEIVNRKVDPGLLEKTKGNNYKVRVYPIPANGTKRIVISFEQELGFDKKGYRYSLPLNFTKQIDEFTFNVEVLKQDIEPLINKSDLDNFTFSKWNESYKALFSQKQYVPSTSIVFTIPLNMGINKPFVESGLRNKSEQFFYYSLQPEFSNKPKKLPSKITILWDASNSRSTETSSKSISLLKEYLRKIENVSITLVVFSNEIQMVKEFQIQNGETKIIESLLQEIVYDGATQFGCLTLEKWKSDEFLLFSDGLSNFGTTEFPKINVPVYSVNEQNSSNHSELKFISATSGGVYINLLQTDVNQALNQLMNKQYQFISATYRNNEIEEVYPSIPTVITKDFSIAGKVKTGMTSMILNFGFGNEITQKVEINIDTICMNNSGLTERLWAMKKANELELQPEKNANEIRNVGKKYNIVTQNSSLIVLETLEDYLRYDITPPIELKEAFLTAKKNMDSTTISNLNKNIEDVVNQFNNRKEWWESDFNQSLKTNGFWLKQKGKPIDLVGGVVSGKVYSALTNEPLSNVFVQIGNTGNGVTTDNNGQFNVVIPKGIKTISFSLKNYKKSTVNLSSNILSVWLEDVTYNKVRSRKSYGSDYGVGSGSNHGGGSGGGRVGNMSPVHPPQVIADEVVEEDIHNQEEIMNFSSNSIRGSNGFSTNEVATSFKEVKSEENTYWTDGISIRTPNNTKKSKIKLEKWSPTASYLSKLKTTAKDSLYVVYLRLKNENKNSPAFYVDVADYFFQKKLKNEGLRILSNLAEIEVQNHQLLRVLAHRLEQLNFTKYAIATYETILKLRSEEPQSYRDLGLAYALDAQYQRAIDTLYRVVSNSWNGRFPGIGVIALEELNNVLYKSNKQGVELKTSQIDNRLKAYLPVDIRVVLNWDSDNCDIDLWVTDPRNEKCFYSNPKTRVGGLISNDFTGGYGPEEFMIKEAIPGKYVVQANYFGTSSQSLLGPTTIQLELYSHYMDGSEKKETITMRLKQNKEVVKIAEFEFLK